MKLSFLGAAREVTGSCFLVEAANARFLVDCGMAQGDMARKFETAIIVVTHDEKIIPTFKRIYHIRDGVTHGEAGEGRGVE